jgi:hypothetical protein
MVLKYGEIPRRTEGERNEFAERKLIEVGILQKVDEILMLLLSNSTKKL